MTTENLTPEAPAPRRSNTLRTVLLVVGSIVLAVIIVGTVTRVAFSLNREDTSGTFAVEQQFDEVKLRTTAADIEVEYGDVDEAELRFDQAGSNLRLDYDVSGSVLKIRVEHPGWGWLGWGFDGWGFGDWGRHQSASLTVTLPEELERDGMDLTVETTAGSLGVLGDYGDVDLESTAGDLRLTGAADGLRINTTAGDVHLDGVSVDGSFRSESTAGDSTFEFESLPDSIDVRSTAGEIRVTLPSGSYRIETDTTAGEVRQHVSSDQDSDRVYRFESTAGSIELNER